MLSAKAEHAPILHVEDDSNDVLFMQLAFKKARLENPLIPVHDGEAAVCYLSNAVLAAGKKPALPCLILTDLKMPRMNGFEFLSWLKQHPDLRHIPTIVLSSSGEPEDRRRAAELGAVDYWVKPAQMEVLMALVKEMRDTWVAAHCS
jgi:CheY-like chemotaxis protein